MNLQISQTQKLSGEISVPGDKSISHRAIMLGALAKGRTTVTNFLTGADCLSTIACFEALGIQFVFPGPETVVIEGKGLNGLAEPADVLNVGNSGTTIRLMMGILAGQKFFSAITGDASIRQRPMGRVTEPLRRMGADISGRQEGRLAPLAIRGSALRPIHYVSPVASAQVKSAILLAGLYASGETTVHEPFLSRDHTERMLAYLGADIAAEETTVKMKGFPELTGKPVEVPGDISSAAFFMVAAAVLPGSRVRLNRIGLNPTRTGILDVLAKMGADMEILNDDLVNGEPVADIIIKGGDLKGTVIEGSLIPRLIDEVPVLAVAAAAASGETVIRDAAELKVKESNRILTIAEELRKIGADVDELTDGLVIRGGRPLKGAVCSSHHDHRIAMSMAVAGLMAEGQTTIQDAECINISFPGFSDCLEKLRKGI